MAKRSLLKPLLLLTSLAVVTGSLGCDSSEVRTSSGARPELFKGTVMGTFWNASVVTSEGLKPSDRESIQALLETALESVDERMSTWKVSSDLSRFNQAGVGQPVAVHGSVLDVSVIALQIFRQSQGAFDPTVGPLVNLWGYGPSRDPSDAISLAGDGEEPRAIDLEAALRQVGLQRGVRLDSEAATLTKLVAGLELDFSAVAKGWAVDRAADALVEAGYANVLVEVGGEVVTRGERSGGGPWRLLIEDPRAAPETYVSADSNGIREPVRVLLRDAALATSGDYRNWQQLGDGSRSTHIIDPRSGRPSSSRVAAASVIAGSCAQADAWATALMVLGEDGLGLIESLGNVEAMLQLRESDSLVRRETSGWNAWTAH